MPGCPFCKENSSGNLTAVNDFGADGVWARHTTTTDWFYTFDPQGNLSQKIGRDGSVLCSSIYDAQGHEATTDTHPDPFSGYGGQFGYYGDWETSTTGGGSCLYLLGHRFYDPDAGRFLTRDPIGYAGGINLYGYTGNDPVNRADPSGFDGFEAGVIGGIIGIGIVVVVTGGLGAVPIIIGGVAGGAVGGFFFGGGPDHIGDGAEGAVGGGFVACVVILRSRPPLFPPGAPPAEPEPPDPNQWPPAPTTPEL